MKNRDYKEFAPNTFYHIYNRGNAKMDIFLDEFDYKFFMHRLIENIFPQNNKQNLNAKIGNLTNYKERYLRKLLPAGSFDLVCYCLMPNHFHLLIRQNSDIKISALLLRICSSYSKYFNKKYNRVGSLFQDQFKAIPIKKNNYLLWLSAYIHKNPIEAGLVTKANDWQWSSMGDFTGSNLNPISKNDVVLGQLQSGGYKNFMKVFEKDESLKMNAYLLDFE